MAIDNGNSSPASTEILAALPSPLRRGTIYLVALLTLAGLAALYFGRVQVVVHAPGRVVPEGDIVLVQALRGGVVNAVLVKAGDRLPAGAPLMKLDVGEVGLNLAEVRRKQVLQSEQLKFLRETAALLGAAAADPDRFYQDYRAGLVGAAGKAMELLQGLAAALGKVQAARREVGLWPRRKEALTRELELARESVSRGERNFASQKSLYAGNERAVTQKREQLEKYRSLAERKLISPQELLGEEEKFRGAETGLMESRQRLERAELDIVNQRVRISELEDRLESDPAVGAAQLRAAEMGVKQQAAQLRQEREATLGQVHALEAERATTQEKAVMAESQLSLTSIAMPVAGMVTSLKVSNSGELVEMGATVATIVPESVPLVVEASVPNRDVGFIRPGLSAIIKVDAYPFQQFGTVAARVSRVLPDLGPDNRFTVKLELASDSLSASDSPLKLFPGLTVHAEMLTARQRLWHLVFSNTSAASKAAR